MTILDKIIENKKKELEILASVTSIRDLENSRLFNLEIFSLSESLLDRSKTGIIAEFKRKSPSRGIINSLSSVREVTSGYIREGASGVSVLTDTQFFGGSNADLLNVREKGMFPILRKDFIIDEFQVVESKSLGADAILLIAAALGKSEILNLARLSRSLGLEVLLEIHEPKELDMVNQYVNIIGVNNRNLKTFEVNTDISEELADKIPPGFIRISESGISSPQIIKKLKAAGYQGFLMGEKFMCTPDPVKTFAEFVKLLI
ncbi:MAG: indole-3-glycerol phosphate synthase TrpC [Bacteroidetes bacterium]|nr:MAG: indole-3-glycerol phosphate synthase TrpC [Bacteroidota bacterium]